MSRQTKDYLDYVRDVLGAPQILMPAASEHGGRSFSECFDTRSGHWPPVGPVDLVIVSTNHQVKELWAGASEVLWEKMKAAMGVSHLRLLEVQMREASSPRALVDLLSAFPAQAMLVLKDVPERTDQGRALAGARVIETFSPATLVERVELKREAWSDLQKLMALLDIAPTKN